MNADSVTDAPPQKAVEIILTRQLASYLAMPVFLVDPQGNLLYYNEPAEALLGHRYEESGELTADVWSTIWEARAEDGRPLAPEELPLMMALTNNSPAHRHMNITGLDGVPRHIEVTAFPLEGQGGRHLGAVAFFWEAPPR
ncbi:MAG TPA: PAS domain-containing protein [Dehalococcoidia bacterium]